MSEGPSSTTMPNAKADLDQAKKANLGAAKVQMDWDDDEEATQVFDKELPDSSKLELEAPSAKPAVHASLDDILSGPPRSSSLPASNGAATNGATLSAAFGALDANGVPARSAPPPSLRAPNTKPASIPPPPPGQTTTAPMHMPPSRPPSAPPPPMGSGFPSGGPPPSAHLGTPASGYPSAPMPSLPPVASVPSMPAAPAYGSSPPSRAMEETAVVPRAQAPRQGKWVALFAAVLVVVGIAVYMMMPRKGTLVVNVADDKGAAVSQLSVYVDGNKQCESAPCIVKELAEGVHEVKVEAKGFQKPAARAVTIESQKSATLDFPLVVANGSASTPAGTGLRATSHQADVTLTVDGKDVGTLPQTLTDLKAGDHKVRFAAGDRYGVVDKTVSVRANEITELGEIALPVVKGKATIQLGTPGAKVYLVSGTNRREIPQFPIAIDLDLHERWQLEAKKEGFEDLAMPITFEAGQAERTIDITLQPKGTQVTSHAHAAQAPVQAQAAAQPPTKPSTAPAEPKKAAATGEGFLNINSLPASTVVLDGKPLGPTPRLKVSVPAGTHTVLFVNSELSLKKSASVTVGAGETKPVIAKLRD